MLRTKGYWLDEEGGTWLARARRWPTERIHIDETSLCVTFKGSPPETWSPGHRRSHTLHTLFIIYSGGRNYIMKQQSVRQYPCTHTHTHTSSFNSMPVRSIWRRANKMKKNYVLQLSYSHRNIAAKSLNWQKNRVIPQRWTDTQIHKTSQAPEWFVNDVPTSV